MEWLPLPWLLGLLCSSDPSVSSSRIEKELSNCEEGVTFRILDDINGWNQKIDSCYHAYQHADTQVK